MAHGFAEIPADGAPADTVSTSTAITATLHRPALTLPSRLKRGGLMKRPRVILGPSQRAAACRAMADALQLHGVELLDLCVGATHWHVLARFTPLPKSPGIKIPGLDFAALKREARRLMGIAKKASARVLSDAGLTAPGGIWAVRCSARPVRNRDHQLALVRYVRAHARQGAAVWSQLRKQSP